MKYPIHYSDMNMEDEFYPEVEKLYVEASNYLLSFNWCESIIDTDLYLNLGSILCVFLFNIDNSASKDDNHLWVIVGDYPPMYLDTHGPNSTKEVLEDYVCLAEDWISHIRQGDSIDECYPFTTEPTSIMADLLEKKIKHIKHNVINSIDDIRIR